MTGLLPLLQPMLATSSEPFDSAGYLYEVKWDGYRGLVYLDGKTALRSRRMVDLTGKFPELSHIHERVTRQPAILDGEIVVLEDGRPSFAGLQARAKDGMKQSPSRRPAVYIVFDVLYAGGCSVMARPLRERKEILDEMVAPDEAITVSRYVLNDGIDFYTACVREGLEGAMAKKLEGAYLPGKRSANWQKFRHTGEADLVICGFQPGRGGGLGSLVLAQWGDGGFVYRGKVGTGWNEEEARVLLEALTEIQVNAPGVILPPAERKRTRWVRPLLVCAVEYLTMTRDGCLRHPVYRGLRTDKSPRECRLEADAST